VIVHEMDSLRAVLAGPRLERSAIHNVDAGAIYLVYLLCYLETPIKPRVFLLVHLVRKDANPLPKHELRKFSSEEGLRVGAAKVIVLIEVPVYLFFVFANFVGRLVRELQLTCVFRLDKHNKCFNY
jgi:hypothetical protein